jgi:tight adherence protein C
MTVVLGALIGLLGGAGLLTAVLASPPMRRPTLSDRIAPYLIDTSVPSRLLSAARPGPGSTLSRLAAPLVRDAVRFLDRVVGGQASVRSRLAALGSQTTVEQFRTDQVMWGAVGGSAGLGIALLAVLSGHRNPIVLALLILASAAGGVLARDWWLTQSVARRNAEILSEFPVIAEMLALAVTAGEGPLGAIDRITRLAHGHLSSRLRAILADTRSGTPLQQALTAARDQTRLEPLSRFLDGMAVAIERGTPLADVLRAQAADVRALGKRQLLEAGGRKEILMMVPVVFLVLPITILFALFPGLIAITTVAH